jgi:uncharacterized protein HemX
MFGLAVLAPLRLVPARVWLWGAAIAAILAVGLTIYLAGRGDEREARDARQAKAEARAAQGREVAASERQLDNLAIAAKQKERDHAAQALPDSAPDGRELRRRCRQLRDAGQYPTACRGLAGPA